MDFEQFRREIQPEVFDYQILGKYMEGLKKPRDKISSLIAENKIVRLKKGLYIFGDNWRRAPISLETIANLMYGPSCVSFEYALTRYGLIAERSSVITSLTIGDTKSFETPLGVFEYRAIDPKKFKIGIEYRNSGKGEGYFIASKEKALVDLVYRTSGIRSLRQLKYYLFEEMRVDETMFYTLDFYKLGEIAKVYDKKSVHMMCELA